MPAGIVFFELIQLINQVFLCYVVRLNFFGNNFHKITASNQIIIYSLFRFIDTN